MIEPKIYVTVSFIKKIELVDPNIVKNLSTTNGLDVKNYLSFNSKSIKDILKTQFAIS
jgi:hypothetical protein